MSEVVDQLFRQIDDGKEGKNIGLKTGLQKLDYYTGGFQRALYKLIFGQSGSSKSSFVIYTDLYRVLIDYPEANILHIYYSLEMSSNVLLAKLLNLYLFETYGIEISYLDLMSVRKPLDDSIYQYVLKGREWLNTITKKLIIFDTQLNADSFYATMMNLLKERGEFVKSADGKRTVYKPKDPSLLINVVIDHLGLLNPSKGRAKKEEMDLCSAYCVRFREVCGVSFDVIMQENRNAGSMDRRKADLCEPTPEDIKDSGNSYNDCNICIAMYYPLKYQLTSYRGYKVLGDDGMGSAIRSAILLKHRFGNANKVFPLGFQGSIGRFVELPKPDLIDYSIYQSWKDEKIEDQKQEDQKIEDNSKTKYSF